MDQYTQGMFQEFQETIQCAQATSQEAQETCHGVIQIILQFHQLRFPENSTRSCCTSFLAMFFWFEDIQTLPSSRRPPKDPWEIYLLDKDTIFQALESWEFIQKEDIRSKKSCPLINRPLYSYVYYIDKIHFAQNQLYFSTLKPQSGVLVH